MDRKYALLFSLLITGLIASNTYLIHQIYKTSSYESLIVSRVIDGDTLILEDGRHVRLLNINSPEKNTFNSNLSLLFLKSYENSSITLETAGTDKYQRILARIYNPETEEYLNLKLVQLGLASKFLVDNSELSLFSKAEEQAIKDGIGIWKKSKYFGCFSSKIDKLKETVLLENKNCNQINLDGFYIKDESRKIYKFKNILLSEGKAITLHSENGEDTSSDLFWNSKTDIWNNDRDTMYLFDSMGDIVHHEAYGY